MTKRKHRKASRKMAERVEALEVHADLFMSALATIETALKELQERAPVTHIVYPGAMFRA